MTKIAEINNLFKRGQYDEAFQIALSDWQQNPTDIWEQRKMGWAYTYMMKRDADNKNFEQFKQHLEQFLELKTLSVQQDTVAFEALIFRISSIEMTSDQRSCIFSLIKKIQFTPCLGYSLVLKEWMKDKEWVELTEFMEWWNLSNLRPEDYQPYEFTDKKGKKVTLMSIAEQAYITYAKLIMKVNDRQKISLFLPQIEKLVDEYPQMTYPGYFYGKLLLALDALDENSLKRLIPFVRRKSRDFWAWQLLSEAYDNDKEKQTACLLRAVSCCRNEMFIVRVRAELARLYAKNEDFARARYHLDIANRAYIQNGYQTPVSLLLLLGQPWAKEIQPNKEPDVDFMRITNSIIGFREPQFSTDKKDNDSIVVEGKVVANKAGTVLFVTDNKRFAYIPKQLATNLQVGDIVRAVAHPSFDKKRGEMGLVCDNIKQNYFENRVPSPDLNWEASVIDFPVIKSHLNEDSELPF